MYNKKIDFKTTEIPTNIEGSVFNREIFDKSGIFIVKNYIGNEIMSELQNSWNAFIDDLVNKGGRTIDNSNFVNFSDNLPPELMDFWKSEVVKKIAIAIWGDDVALYNSRIVMKDKKSEHIVMLHQDYCYHIGFPQKCSLFIPLFKCGEDEGSLSFYPGTHQYGYLGDAGEIDPDKFHNWSKITPTIESGDIAIMNSCLWHESGPNITNNDRVMFDIIIQPSNDPSGTYLIAGDWKTDFWIDRKNKDFEVISLFKKSRAKTIKNNFK